MKIFIKDIEVFLTCPDGQNLLAVKVLTSQDGLYGLGCASHAYRAYAVKEVLEKSFRPLLIGRDASQVEDISKLLLFNGYWRNGPIGNNAASGIDMALWDIKAKMANMCLYDLLGGKCREKVTVYRHCNAPDKERILEAVDQVVKSGCKYIRTEYTAFDKPTKGEEYLCLANSCKHYDPKLHIKNTLDLLYSLRDKYGDSIELITDTHERLDPSDAATLARKLEDLDLFFMEDPLSGENIDWLQRIRNNTTTPLAIGENFTNQHEWKPLIEQHLIDYIRCHLSMVGGLTPARKIAALAELNGVKTAWHGPLDMTPIAMAVQAHLDYAIPNFGIQEYYGFSEETAQVFPGSPVYKDGCLILNEKPGHGVDFDEREARKYPPHQKPTLWTEMRLPDSTIHTH